MNKGYIHIYTGNGKGKTTAAIGLAIRAAGHGMKTFIGQFMKGQYYGELSVLNEMNLIDVEQFGDEGCITRDQVTPAHREHAQKGIERIGQIFESGQYDIVVMDEVCVTIWFGILTESQVLDVIRFKPVHTELILTGRYAPQSLIAQADLVTSMEEVKHYYNTHEIPSRKGIEN
ncbi:MAG: cob(I)yrinic acid a,c-diamide adenosyltransferase [Desulfobacteraceae bacterium]|nr:MAG: cob(I)yrinic acid a,c-diamide adenosyltransferase [Desulfobacteraceae bacterium]